MPKKISKHGKGQDQLYKFQSFHEGFTEEIAPAFLSPNQLSECQNMKYVMSSDGQRVTLKKRQGTTIISNSALTSAADVLACTYYIGQSEYILATATKLYKLDGSLDPVEIGSSLLEGVPTFTEFNGKLIIHDGGVTKYYDGTNSGKIVRSYQDEVLGTGNGATTNFTGNLSNTTVKTSSITISFTAGGTAKTITDNGSGALTGDVDAGGTNTINYTTGAYNFTCDAAPDDETSVTADYQQVDGCSKSKAGLVRGSRLYLWGDTDNPSRLTYSEVNDEKATDSSSGGGYLDIDPSDGYSLLGGLNFETSMLLMKQNSLHRIDAYPDDDDFRAEKLTDDLGTVAHRTPLFEGDIVSFVAKEGWVAMHPSQRYGDIQKGVPLSKPFRTKMARYNNSTAYTAFNPVDKQLWISLSTDGSTTYLPDIYVVNLETGGQVSRYKFKFSHSCYTYVNGWMLIGGADGNLYKLDDTNTVFTDNEVDYSDITYARTGFVDWQTPDNTKHNKKIFVNVIGKGGASLNLDLYRNNNFESIMTIAIEAGSSWAKIYEVTSDIYLTTGSIGQTVDDIEFKRKFNWESVMARFSSISGESGTEILGIGFKAAQLGER